MKARVLISLAALTLACGSTDDDKGHASGGKGSGATGTGGTTMIAVTGGSSGSSGTINASGGSANGSSASGGTANTGTSGKTAADLRADACIGWNDEPELLPVVLMLVVDNSASMRDRPNRSQNGGSKWEITRDALASTLEGMPASAAVGVLYFPNMNTSGSEVERPIDQCVNINAMIPIDLLADANSGQRSTIATSLANTNPQGSTPTHDAYDYALVNGMQASKLTGNRFMLLITDGAPTLAKGCQGGGMPDTPAPTDPIIEEVLAAR